MMGLNLIKILFIASSILGAFILPGHSAQEKKISDEKHNIHSNLYPEIEDDGDTLKDAGLYVGKITKENQPLWLVMERITDKNIKDWQHYASIQSNPRAIEVANIPQGTTGDGSKHFSRVLHEVNYDKNEIWVAYISKEKDVPMGIHSMENYKAADLDALDNDFGKNTLMFVSVTSSPEALITSHLGVAVSVEGVKSQRPRGISMDLHSFAAKVLRKRNPGRLLMINAPAFAMEKIMNNALEGSVFAGTREMKNVMEDRKSVKLSDFKTIDAKKLEGVKNEIKEDAENELNNATRVIKTLSSEKVKGYLEKVLSRPNSLLEEKSNGVLQVSENKMTSMIERGINEEFIKFKNPYAFFEGNLENASEKFLEFLEKHPPLLSVDSVTSFKNHMTIYNKNNPEESWLTINETNKKDYEWMFSDPFKPAGKTHYIVVNLERLADYGKLDVIS